MTSKKTTHNKQSPGWCRLCRSALEQVEEGWICPSCLVRWHGDTFEPLEEDTPGLPPYFDFRFGT